MPTSVTLFVDLVNGIISIAGESVTLGSGDILVLNKHVAKYAIPREIEFRSELPKTLVGKVFFRKLEEEANAEVDRKKNQTV